MAKLVKYIKLKQQIRGRDDQKSGGELTKNPKIGKKNREAT